MNNIDVQIKDALEKNNINALINLSQRVASMSQEEQAERKLVKKKMALLGGYTTHYLSHLLRILFYQQGIYLEILECEAGAFESLIASKDQTLLKFKPDVCYLCVGTDHLKSVDLEQEASRWRDLWEQIKQNFHCEIITNNFVEPIDRIFGNFEKQVPSQGMFIQELNQKLREHAPSYVHFCDMDFLASCYGKIHWLEPKWYDLAKLPVAFEMLPAYADNICRVSQALWGRSKKCLILDLDNTLWGGEVGEVGAAGLTIGDDNGIGESFKRFQIYIKQLKDRGVILAICSKNDLAVVHSAFSDSREMVLKREDFACIKANWQPKHENIMAISEELQILTDAMVFIDDSAVERDSVRFFLPEVAVLDLPEDPADFVRTLSLKGYFETTSLTEEDLKRSKNYSTDVQRKHLHSQFSDYSLYLESLEMWATFEDFNEDQLPRIVQLINKTNQFNLTTQRYSEAQVRDMMASDQYITKFVKLRDRFSDSGLISVIVLNKNSDEAHIDTWLMSCRVLKRGVENFVFEQLVQELKKEGIKLLKGRYSPTAKNTMVKDLLGEMGLSQIEKLPMHYRAAVSSLQPKTSKIRRVSENEFYKRSPNA